MFDYISARTMKSNASLAGQDFPVLGAGAAAPPAPIQRYVCPVFSLICHVYAFFSCGNVYFLFAHLFCPDQLIYSQSVTLIHNFL